jgi:hypothetical protein
VCVDRAALSAVGGAEDEVFHGVVPGSFPVGCELVLDELGEPDEALAGLGFGFAD